MAIVVADANIFVYLFRCQLLTKLLSNNQFKVIITQAVFDELVNSTKRISREHPSLRGHILTSIHNTANKENLQVMSINDITNINAINIYYLLEESGELDLGEMESIPLSIAFGGIFVSHDHDAIKIANSINSGLGVIFLDFCNNLTNHQVFTQADLATIEQFLEHY